MDSKMFFVSDCTQGQQFLGPSGNYRICDALGQYRNGSLRSSK